jgi:hypothetical protein
MDLFPVRSGGVVAPGRGLRQSAKRTPAMRPGSKAAVKAYTARAAVTYLMDGLK